MSRSSCSNLASSGYVDVPLTSFKGAQSKLQARVIAGHITVHKAGYNLGAHVGYTTLRESGLEIVTRGSA
jgi:uncharacterized protein with PIN domain